MPERDDQAVSILDDDRSLGRSLRNLLRPLGFRIETFSSGEVHRHPAKVAVLRYALAVASVGVTMAVALSLRSITLASGQLLVLAVLVSGWVAGLRAALVAWILASLAFEYYF